MMSHVDRKHSRISLEERVAGGWGSGRGVGWCWLLHTGWDGSVVGMVM